MRDAVIVLGILISFFNSSLALPAFYLLFLGLMTLMPIYALLDEKKGVCFMFSGSGLYGKLDRK